MLFLEPSGLPLRRRHVACCARCSLSHVARWQRCGRWVHAGGELGLVTGSAAARSASHAGYVFPCCPVEPSPDPILVYSVSELASASAEGCARSVRTITGTYFSMDKAEAVKWFRIAAKDGNDVRPRPHPCHGVPTICAPTRRLRSPLTPHLNRIGPGAGGAVDARLCTRARRRHGEEPV